MNKGLFIHLVVTVVLISAGLYIGGAEGFKRGDRFLFAFIIVLVNTIVVGISNDCDFYNERIKL